MIEMLQPRPRVDEGMTIIEVLIAVILVAVAVLASMRLTVAVLSVMGRAITGAVDTQDAKPARIRSVAAAWAQAELEFIKQIGFDSACPPTQESCTIWVPNDCRGGPSDVIAVYGESPPLPTGLAFWNVTVQWDPRTPDVAGERLLRLVEVDLYRDAAECNARTPFIQAYTSLRRE